jgi:cytochrome c-type biogenesis protein CcmE
MRFTKPVIALFLIFLIYVVYSLFFAESKEISDFTKLSPDDNKNVDVRVYLAKDKPIQIDPVQNFSIFYVKDKNAKLYKVQGPADVPEGFHEAEVIIIRGHLHHDYFHASSIVSIVGD